MEGKYKNSKIYAIRNYINDDVYIGSTTQPLSKRMVEHRSRAKTHPDRILYKKMNELGSDQFYIELVKNYPCNNSEQLYKREGKYIRKLATLNQVVAGRSDRERYEDNRNVMLAKCKAYREKNKDTIKAKQQEWRETNKDVIAQKCKAYREKNKDTIKAKQKEWREANREHLLAQKKEQHDCECGGRYTNGHKARHFKSQKHQTYLSSRSTTANNSDSDSSDSD